MENNTKEGGFGAALGIFIIIVVLIAGVVYFAGQQKEKIQTNNNLSSSDDIETLEKDAAAIDLDNLGEGIDNLE
jgi:uncharacterized protein HemX